MSPGRVPTGCGLVVHRGYFNVNSSLANADGVFPDTYINVGKYSWAKGVAFINGFNLVSASSASLCHHTSEAPGILEIA